MRFFVGMVALFILGCSSAPHLSTRNHLFEKYVRYVPNQADPRKRVEFFMGGPEDSKKHPALIFVHAYQDEQRSGGYHQIATGRFQNRQDDIGAVLASEQLVRGIIKEELEEV